jgi:hypothetical protein
MSRYVEVEVDLVDFDDEELRSELESRGYEVKNDGTLKDELIESIWLKRRLGQDYQADLDSLIYKVTGRAI